MTVEAGSAPGAATEATDRSGERLATTDRKAEHIELAAIGREFHELMLTVCSGQPVRRDRVLAQAEQFLGRQRRHMHEEGHRVFRIAGEVLTEADFEALERRRGSGADPLFGEQLREDFVRLREAILAAGV